MCTAGPGPWSRDAPAPRPTPASCAAGSWPARGTPPRAGCRTAQRAPSRAGACCLRAGRHCACRAAAGVHWQVRKARERAGRQRRQHKTYKFLLMFCSLLSRMSKAQAVFYALASHTCLGARPCLAQARAAAPPRRRTAASALRLAQLGAARAARARPVPCAQQHLSRSCYIRASNHYLSGTLTKPAVSEHSLVSETLAMQSAQHVTCPPRSSCRPRSTAARSPDCQLT